MMSQKPASGFQAAASTTGVAFSSVAGMDGDASAVFSAADEPADGTIIRADMARAEIDTQVE